MKREDILQALDEISDARIEKAARPPKKKAPKAYWYGGIAAVLAIAILLGIFLPGGNMPGVIQAEAKAIATALYPKTNGGNMDVSSYMAELNDYFSRTMALFLQSNESNDNVAFSPMNLYMALAMLAETTDGQTRAEILSLLGATDIESLQDRANALWRASYRTGDAPCTLANSVWMQKGADYNGETMQTLAENYFASVYENDFTLPDAAHPIAQWIDEETGGLLKEQTGELEFDPLTVMALVSTLYLQAQWMEPFDAENNSQEIFNGTNGQQKCTFMNQYSISYYYWGEDYTAAALHLDGPYTMWFVLPNEGKTTADLLQSGNYTELFLSGSAESRSVLLKLSMPKFDVVCKQDMIDGLQALGVRQVFALGQADFSPAFPDMAKEVYVNKVEQATRVRVDEEGVTAASYTVIGAGEGTSLLPKEEVNFVLDRPYLFTITNIAGIPLFAGVVNNP